MYKEVKVLEFLIPTLAECGVMATFKLLLLAVRLFSLHTVLVDPEFRSKCGARYVTFQVPHISVNISQLATTTTSTTTIK